MYVSDALNPNDRHNLNKAKSMYEEIRRRKTDCENIVRNVNDFSIEQIQIIKNYLFYDKHILMEGFVRFSPDICISHSWFRLSERSGKNIKPHDILMLYHELYEIDMLLHNTHMTQQDAHAIATQKYNYEGECKRIYHL